MAQEIIKSPAQIRYDGILLDSIEGTWEVNILPNHLQFESMMTANGNLVASAKRVPSSIKGKLLLSSVGNIPALLGSNGVSIVVTGPSHTYILSNAIIVSNGQISADSSELEVEFHGYGQILPIK